MAIADQQELASIAFPSISTGVFRFPIELAAQIAVNSVIDCLPSTPTLESVEFCCFSSVDLAVYLRVLRAG
jgi:O-acetyl-ADP-ribose deacetylase (regulator of RNase III)